MGFEQKTASIHKLLGTDFRKHCGFTKKNDAFNEVYPEGLGYDKYWDVENKKGELLGVIEYFKKFKKWTWEQGENIVMTWDCLQEVVDFLKEIKDESPIMFEEVKE